MSSQTPHIYNLEIAQALGAFETTKQGLTAEEAAARLADYGPNALTTKKEPFWKRLLEPFASAFVLVLLFALVLSIIEKQVVDAVIIAVIVGVNAIIYYFQQYSVGRVLKTLKSQDVSYANVIRGGETLRIPSEELTYGDIIHIEEGMKVPADGRIIEANQVQADESLLTGESLPVHKHAGAIGGADLRVYDQQNMLFKGAYVKTGNGLLMVTGIGNETQLGDITQLAAGADIGRAPIERKIDDLTKKLIIGIAIAASLALALAIYRGIAIEEAVRFSLVIVVSAVPEGLPVALTIVLLLSARRMAKVKALVKKTQSIETMGAITLIATDKTGTITQNKLSVAGKHTTHGSAKTFDEVILASLNIDGKHAADPLDKILLDSIPEVQLPPNWRQVREFPFNQALRLSGILWQHPKGYSLYVKGAPEQVLGHCSQHAADVKLKQTLDGFTSSGYRTIAFGHKDFTEPIHELNAKALGEMRFDGFVGMADQLRPEVAQSVAEAKTAGIKVVMLTGDHVNTAGFIARQVGIAATPAEVSDSGVLANGGPEDIREKLQTIRVFGRVLPEHKYALLKAAKGYEITAMTGDGVNDIPALVEADAGIAMGSGTDAAKDASDIVILDDNFRTMVSAIKVGRTALANIRKMVMYLLGTSGGEVLTMLTALILGIPLPVAAIQILWINLVTDGVSVIPLGLSPAEDRQMQQPPRSPNAALLNVRQTSRFILMAVVMAISVLLIFNANLDKGHIYAQTLAFLSLIVVQWANAFNINYEYKSWVYNFIKPNKLLWGAIGFSIILQIFVFMTPFGKMLHVVPVAAADAVVAILAPMFAVLLAVDLHKWLFHHLSKRHRR